MVAEGPEPSHDPGIPAAVERATHSAAGIARLRVAGAEILFGTAGWTDATLTAQGVFYPDGVKSPEARLKYYATRFPLVEVDSAYYALPSRRAAELWVDRTPADFVFDLKAYALMTGHGAEVERLPRVIQDALPNELAAKQRVYAKELPPEIDDAVWRWYADAVAPLAEAGKLGAILLQYPPWFQPTRWAARELERARARMAGLPLAVEFRHPAWLSERLRARTLDLLRRNDLTYVSVDEPQGTEHSVPPVTAVTTPRLAVVRLHGRRADHWTKRGATVLEKYRYLYDRDELAEWAPKVVEVAGEAERVHVVFNNCYGNYGTTNALELAGLMMRELSC